MEYLLFGDIETGGLDGLIERNGELGMKYYPILELAFVLTNLQLEQIGEPLRIVISHTDGMILRSDGWSLKTHQDSGLLEQVRKSTILHSEAEQQVLDWLQQNGVSKYSRKNQTGAVFAGNSIKLDRNFLMCQMPKLHEYLHYRQLDISAIALAARAFAPNLEKNAVAHKQYSHEALADIQESIQELRFYKDQFFKLADGEQVPPVANTE